MCKTCEKLLLIHKLNTPFKGFTMKMRTEPSSCGKLTQDAKPALVPAIGNRVLAKRYLKKDEHGVPAESPEEMFRRVAHEIARIDTRYGESGEAMLAEKDFFESMARLEFLPNSPTLINAGRDLGQLSACFVLPIEDSLDSIFETVKNTALIHKSGGGTGFSFSRIRPKGSRVRSTQGVSSGPVSFMRVFDAATEAVKQGGVRRGANMGVLRVDHPDILEFLNAKSCAGELRNFNISIAVGQGFMEAADAGADYEIINPWTGRPAGSYNAAEIFRRICRSAWKCGDPGLLFIDRVNRDNPLPCLGEFETTNPCGEQPLLPYESCNLGSINLSKMVGSSNGQPFIDFDGIRRTTWIAVHFLDNVIDANNYPLPQIAAVTRGSRKIGVGVMGWADMLIKLGVPYDSPQAVALAEDVMSFIQREGRQASFEIASRRGPYPDFYRSMESGKKEPVPQRNATVTTIAPAGTLSMIAGCSSGIEPLFALSYIRKQVLDGGELRETNTILLDELSRLGLFGSDILNKIEERGSVAGIPRLPEDMVRRYRTALEIAPEWHVRMQAAFQKYSDNGVSKTVNMAFESTPEDVAAVFRLAARLGCKGITVYRDRCRESQVLNVGCACA
jgi:ribonucleoside-diphosphate reductase alpha chain